MSKKNVWTAVATLMCAGSLANAASAQPVPGGPEAVGARGETVLTRARPELEPLGVRAGSFFIYPKLGVEGTYDDNVFATKHHTKDDFVTSIKPEVSIESDWANHALDFSTGADSGFYSDFTRLNYTDWFVSGNGRVDITRDAALFAGGGYARDHEDPGEPDADANAKRPTEFDLINGFTRYVQKVGRFRGIGEVNVIRLDYDKTDTFNAGSQSNTDRDRTVTTGGLQVGYEFLPSYEAFVRAEGNDRTYDQKVDAGGVERSSNGYTAVAGIALDLGGVMFGDVYAGYLEQIFDEGQFNDVSGFTAGGTLTWNVTTLTTLNARAARIVQDTTQAGSPAILRTTGGLTADHELLRNLILSAGLTVTNDDYEDISRNDYYYISGVGARYLMNRNFYANVGYQHIIHDSNGSGDDSYDENLFRIGIEAQL
jgi:hypothetical protein